MYNMYMVTSIFEIRCLANFRIEKNKCAILNTAVTKGKTKLQNDINVRRRSNYNEFNNHSVAL